MKEEKTKSKKRFIYYILLAISVLLLVAATVLTVYFVTGTGNSTLEEKPPVSGPDEPNKPEEPDGPTGGEEVLFVSPIEDGVQSVSYNVIYTNNTLGWIYRHKAVDFMAEEGTNVRCMADGYVESISASSETGNIVTINHGGNLRTVYRFIEANSNLKVGATVKKGESIGTVAAAYGTEHRDGTHLHLEIKLGDKFVDPEEYLTPILSEK